MRRILAMLIGFSAILSTGQSIPAHATSSRSPRPSLHGPIFSDFNADGFADLAVGIRQEDVGTTANAGAVSVLHGTASGLQSTSPDDQLWTQDSPGVQGEAGRGDLFGTAVAAGDYNGDTFADLAIGIPQEDLGATANAGAVSVLYGSPAGLQAASPDDQLWTQDSPDVEDQAEQDDLFGTAVSAGDFNGDGFADLAAGVYKESVGGVLAAGAVNVLYGSPAGLQATAPADQLWTQDSPDVEDQGEFADFFGFSLANADFNGDGSGDLAVGVRLEDVGSVQDAGAASVLYGSPAGLQATSPDDQFWTQDSPGVLDEAEPFDWFGYSLAEGDFNADGFADLVIWVCFEDVGAASGAGSVSILYGSAAGVQATSPDDQHWTQDSPSVKDQAEESDDFGSSLTATDFNGDGFGDVAIGIRLEDLGTIADAGAVTVLHGSPAGLQATAPDDQFWTQASPGVKDAPEAGDDLAFSVATADFNADDFGDLAIGVRLEDLGAITDAGAVAVLYGTAAGLQATSPDDQLWGQDSPGVLDQAEPSDWFGFAMAAGGCSVSRTPRPRESIPPM